MKEKLKKRFFIGSLVLVLLLVGVLTTNAVVKHELKKRIDNFSETIKIDYQDIKVNVLTGSAELINPKISVYGKTTKAINAEIELKQLSINNLSYWDYFSNDKISLKNIILTQPKTVYHHNDLVDFKSYQNTYEQPFKKTVEIKAIEIIDGKVAVFDVANDSLLLKSEQMDFKANNIALKKSNPEEKASITFQDYLLTFSNLFYRLNDYENVFVKYADFNTDFHKIETLSLKTKYSQELLSKQISVERDHFDLTIDSIKVENHDFGIKNDSLFYFGSKRVDFYQPKLNIYRDKLIADDLSYKPLYSKSLRNLNVDIALETVFLNKATIVYIEKVKEDTEGGQLEFSNLNAEITNLGNTYRNVNEETSVNIDAIFMKNTPISVDWSFDVQNSSDEFVFKADVGNLAANQMNQFMEPNLNLRLNGEINKTYFTISGNDYASLIDLKLQYTNFDVVVLKQNGTEKNKLLSGLINIFVSKDSSDKQNEFRYGQAKDIERDKTKSVFNYLWLNIKAGLLSAVTGNGEKN